MLAGCGGIATAPVDTAVPEEAIRIEEESTPESEEPTADEETGPTATLPPRADHFRRILFLHHTTGAGLIAQGGIRERLTERGYEFYDHCTRRRTMRSATSCSTMLSPQVVLPGQRHPDKIFVVVSPSPLVPSATSAEVAARACAHANWLKSQGFLNGHPNVFTFDLFNLLAESRPGAPDSNMLRADYRSAADDSHPNELANQQIGPQFVDFIVTAINSYAAR